MSKTVTVTHACGTISDEVHWRCAACSERLGTAHKAGCARIDRESCEHRVRGMFCNVCYPTVVTA
jgi:hypothetical protein